MEPRQTPPLTTLLIHFAALGCAFLGIASLALLLAWIGRQMF